MLIKGGGVELGACEYVRRGQLKVSRESLWSTMGILLAVGRVVGGFTM